MLGVPQCKMLLGLGNKLTLHQIEAGAFQYRGFADLTQPIPDADVALGNLYSVLNNVTAANINPEWGGLSAASGGTANGS